MAGAHHRVEIRRNPNYQKSGLKSYVYCLNKYNIAPTTEGPYLSESGAGPGKFTKAIRKAVGKEGDASPHGQHVLKKRTGDSTLGDVPADDQQNDSLYLASVTVGTPPQKVSLDFDTGSADLWLWSTGLPASLQAQGKTSGHAIFDPDKSSTFKVSNQSSWKISYGDGSGASGTVGTDVLTLGGLSIEDQAVELATSLSKQFTTGPGDGLLGLAFGNINTVKPTAVKTPVDNLIAQKDISLAVFTAHLGSWKDAPEDDGGISFYTFGYIDPAPLQRAKLQQPYYTPVDSSAGFWQFPSVSATVNGNPIARGDDNTAIADTGTTLALVSDDLCKAIYDAIPGARYDKTNQGWIYPANTPEASLPVVAFAVGDRTFAVQKEDLGFAEAEGLKTYVYGGIQSRGDIPFDIFGDTWLKSVYAIFDMGNKRFGAVPRVEEHQNLGVQG